MRGKLAKILLFLTLFAAASVYSSALAVVPELLAAPSAATTSHISPPGFFATSQPDALAEETESARGEAKRLILFSERPTNWARLLNNLKTDIMARATAHTFLMPDFPICRVFNKQLAERAAPRPPALFHPVPRSPPV